MPPPVQIATKRISQPKVGWNCFNAKSLKSDIRVDHDVEIVMRDGARLYADVSQPIDENTKVPAVLSWSFYGKKYSAHDMLPSCVWKCCVPGSDLSGLEKFEGLDPEHWCPRGYAIVSVDTRGAGNSDGQICVMGTQDAEDGYDVVEAITKKDWCNGFVGMAGNSALAISQWFIAAQKPPSLKAIGPWDGMSDLFREQFCRGGWFTMSNFDLINKLIVRGPLNSAVEDFEEMYRRSPLSNAYWKDKRVDMTKIECPAYIRGSDVSMIHTMGAIRGFWEIPHDRKWLQWGSKQEWFELYSCPKSMVELGQFFDRYLKGVENGWEETPKVRWSALQFGDKPAIDDIVLEDFPVPSTQYREFFLQGDRLVDQPGSEHQKFSYNSEDHTSFAEFTYTFGKKARLIGLPKAVLYMSCRDKDDFTTFLILRKKDKNGKALMHLNFPITAAPVDSIDDIPLKDYSSTNLHLGSVGILRASHREIDHSKSFHPHWPFRPHEKEDKIPPGTIVKLEIGIWAMGIDFEEGESVSLRVGGQFPSIQEYKSFSGPRPKHELNRGKHFIHTGGEYPDGNSRRSRTTDWLAGQVKCDAEYPKCHNCRVRNDDCVTEDAKQPGVSIRREWVESQAVLQPLATRTQNITEANGATTLRVDERRQSSASQRNGDGIGQGGHGNVRNTRVASPSSPLPSTSSASGVSNSASLCTSHAQQPFDVSINLDYSTSRLKVMGGSSTQTLSKSRDLFFKSANARPMSDHFMYGMRHAEEFPPPRFPIWQPLPDTATCNAYLDTFSSRFYSLYPIFDLGQFRNDVKQLMVVDRLEGIPAEKVPVLASTCRRQPVY
ncbi:hypothetical protein LRP88_09448 [Fusarium phalaenopsidis]